MRNRIVINLNAPEGNAAQRAGKTSTRRWPKILAILLGLFVAILVAAAVGGFLWLRHYRSTPTYTLALILDAAQRNDVAEFQKRMDDEEMAKNMAASVSQKAAGRYGLSMNSAPQPRIDSLMPSRMKQTIHDEVLQVMKQFALAPHQRPFISLVAAVQTLMTVTTEGDTAKATGTIAGHSIELTMRRAGDRWKVTEVKDDVIVQRVVDSLMKELPAADGLDPSSLFLKKPARRPKRGRR
jgi:uncharacterized membrane protein